MLVDLLLPKRDGMDVLAAMRDRHDDAAVLVLSGRNDLNARVQCLNMGADDYLQKPLSCIELTARCRALLRRRERFADPVLRCGDIELNRIEHKVTRGDRAVPLTAKEFSLLEYLLQHQGECVSRSQLLREVWQMTEQTGTNVVDVYVNYLRRKMDGESQQDGEFAAGYGSMIETVRGAGYRLSSTVRKVSTRETGCSMGAGKLAYA